MVFKPLDIRKKGRKKKRTNEQRIKEMRTKELACELALIADWDRSQLEKAKKGPGLEKFMEDWLREPARED